MYQPNNESKRPPERNEELKVAEAGPSRVEVIDSSDEEQELSHAEESVIDECLNDTEGSLSSVDLDFFAPSPPHKRSTKKRKILDFDDDSSLQSISSLEDVSDLVSNRNEVPELTNLNITPSSIEELSKLQKQIDGIVKSILTKEKKANEVSPRRGSAKGFTSVPKRRSPVFNTPMPIRRRIARRKRRNSPPTKKYEKAHIYSFFSAMAYLVEIFPPSQIKSAERNVTTILSEMALKVENWMKDTSPNKPFRDAVEGTNLGAIKLRLLKAPFHWPL